MMRITILLLLSLIFIGIGNAGVRSWDLSVKPGARIIVTWTGGGRHMFVVPAGVTHGHVEIHD